MSGAKATRHRYRTVIDSFDDKLVFDLSGNGVEMFPEGDIESFLFEKHHLETLELIVAKLKAEE